MDKIIFSGFAFLFLFFATKGEVLAHCPLCVAAAGAGLTLSDALGIDDSITGIWLGAFIGATSLYTQRLLSSRWQWVLKRWVGTLISLAFVFLTILSFYRFNLVVRHGDIFGFDKLPFGMVLGVGVFLAMDYFNNLIKTKNGKALFPYQSIVLSFFAITLASFLVYILINFYI